jgi:hypothetical protein
MSVEKITDPGDGGPLHVIFRVSAEDYDSAATAAKVEAKATGWRTKTRGGAWAVGPGEWLVELRARPPVPA